MHKSVTVALAEVGYLEKQSPENLDDKLANPGQENYTKYARDMASHLGFYRGSKQGYPWCDVFVDWCFVEAYGVQNARRLLCQPIFSRGAGCRYSFEYYRQAGRLFSDPQPGDQIFFQREGSICHTGIVTDVTQESVCTVEGNTSDEEGVIPNGGCVTRKRYPLDSPLIAGFGRPDYSLVGEMPDIAPVCPGISVD